MEPYMLRAAQERAWDDRAQALFLSEDFLCFKYVSTLRPVVLCPYLCAPDMLHRTCRVPVHFIIQPPQGNRRLATPSKSV